MDLNFAGPPSARLLMAVAVAAWETGRRADHHASLVSTPDAACYLSIARSMVTSSTVTRLGSSNLYFGIGYPTLISPVFLAGPEPFFLLSLVHAAWAVVYAVGVFRWVRRYDLRAGLPIAMLAIGNAVVLLNFRRTLSEVAFCGVLLWLVNAYAVLFDQGRVNRHALLAAIVLQALLPLIRPAGIVFVTGFLVQVFGAVRRGELTRIRALSVAGAVGCQPPCARRVLAYRRGGGFAITNGTGPTGHSERLGANPRMPRWSRALRRMAAGLWLRGGEICRLLIPGAFDLGSGWLQGIKILYLPALAALAFGWYRLIRLPCDAFAWSLPAYVVLHVYWPCAQGSRFFVPLLPLLLLCCWLSLRRLHPRGMQFLWCMVALHMACAVGHWLSKDRFLAERTNRGWSDMRCLADVARAEAGPLVASPEVGDCHYALEYLVDRPVHLSAEDLAPPADSWLVVTREAGCPAGWTERATAGAFRLLRPLFAGESRDAPARDLLAAETR